MGNTQSAQDEAHKQEIFAAARDKNIPLLEKIRDTYPLSNDNKYLVTRLITDIKAGYDQNKPPPDLTPPAPPGTNADSQMAEQIKTIKRGGDQGPNDKRQAAIDELQKLVDRTNPKLSEANRTMALEFIADLKKQIAANTPSGGGTPPEDDEPGEEPLFMNRLEGYAGGESMGSGVSGPIESQHVASRFFPYFVKDDEVARYADGVNQVTNLRKIRK